MFLFRVNNKWTIIEYQEDVFVSQKNERTFEYLNVRLYDQTGTLI